MSLARAALTAMLCLAPITLPAMAQDYSEEDLAAGIEFTMHYATSIMYHEIGHMLIGELGLPVLGKEEDAADSLSAILLLNDDTDPDSWNALVDSSDGWYFSATHTTGTTLEDFSYYDEHSLDIQRAYAMVCMMVGKEPEYFAQTAEAYELDQDRVDGCAYTYQQAYNAWDTLLKPHMVDKKEGAQIKIVYDEGEDFSDFAGLLKEHQLLEKAAALVMSKYVLPREITFHGGECGEANAYYSPSDGEVIFCYEMAADTLGLYLNDILPLMAADGSEAPADEEGTGADAAETDAITEGLDAQFKANP